MTKRSRYLIELASDIIYTADEQGRFVQFNPQAHTILGYSRQELLGRHYLDLVRPDQRASIRRHYERQYMRRIPNTYREFPCVAKDGSTVWLGQNVQFLYAAGESIGFQAVARDVTDRVNNEMLNKRLAFILEMVAKSAPLGETLDRLCRTVEDLSQGMKCSVVLSENGVIQHAAAPTIARAYIRELDTQRIKIGPHVGSCGSASFLGETVIVADIGTDPKWTAFRDLALRHGLHACWSTPIFSSDDKVLGAFSSYYGTRRAPTAFESELVKRCTGLAGIAIERARTENEIRRLNEDLEERVRERTRELAATNALLQTEIVERKRTEAQLLQAKSLESVGRLAGGVAHEFNNWLTVILLYAEQLSEDLPSGGELSQSVDEIRRAADRASSLTRQLLAFGRKQVLQPKLLDLNSMLSNFSNVVRSILGPHIRLRTDLAPFLGTVKADPSQIEQVLVNLTLNARDAMPTGGVMTLRTLNTVIDERSGAYQNGVPPGEYVTLEAADSGVGMDSTTRERIFEPFFTTKRVGQGSGLGLATVYGVIRQSGGHILVRSEPGSGAVFQIFLPLHCESASQTEKASAAAPAEPEVHGKTAIVVDDDATIRELVGQALRKMGCDVIEARDAAYAYEFLQREARHVDLLLTDVVMPGMGGRELAELALNVRPALKVLFISAYAYTELDGDRFRGAAVEFLGKPFTKEKLAQSLAKLLAIGTSESDSFTARAGQQG